MRTAPRISVIIPLAKERGAETECLRTWTHGQTLPRDQYEVVLITRHEYAHVDEQARPLLQPHDQWISTNGTVAHLYHAGAMHAAAPLLVFTEMHCLADATCLEEIVEWADRHPEHAGACVQSRYRNASIIGEMAERIFNEQFAAWSQPDHWHKVLARGFALRTDVYRATDGFLADYPDFADVILSAQLHRDGWSIGLADRAWVTHINPATWAHLRMDAETYGFSEHRFRLRSDALDYVDYLPPDPEWHGALADVHARPLWEAWTLFAEVLRAAARPDVDVRHVAREIASVGRLILERLVRVAGGSDWRLTRLGVRLAWAHARFRWGHHFGVDRCETLKEIWALLIQESLVRSTRSTQVLPEVAALSSGEHDAERIPLQCWHGIHSLETTDGRGFRWTEPISRLSWQLPPREAHELILDTGGLRSPLSSALLAVYWNGRRLASESIHVAGDRVRLSVVSGDTPMNELMIVCLPFTPSCHGSADGRMLGLPIFSIGCGALGERAILPFAGNGPLPVGARAA